MINDKFAKFVFKLLRPYENREVTAFGMLVFLFIVVPAMFFTLLLDILLFPLELIIFIVKESDKK